MSTMLLVGGDHDGREIGHPDEIAPPEVYTVAPMMFSLIEPEEDMASVTWVRMGQGVNGFWVYRDREELLRSAKMMNTALSGMND